MWQRPARHDRKQLTTDPPAPPPPPKKTIGPENNHLNSVSDESGSTKSGAVHDNFSGDKLQMYVRNVQLPCLGFIRAFGIQNCILTNRDTALLIKCIKKEFQILLRRSETMS